MPWLVPSYALLNPGRNYSATQRLANEAVSWPFAGYPSPHHGLRAPAVRSRHAPADSQVNYVLYRLPGTPLGQQEGRWRLRIEFLDLNGNPVGPGSSRIDWSHPRFQLLAAPGGGAAPALPATYALAIWYRAHVNHT